MSFEAVINDHVKSKSGYVLRIIWKYPNVSRKILAHRFHVLQIAYGSIPRTLEVFKLFFMFLLIKVPAGQ